MTLPEILTHIIETAGCSDAHEYSIMLDEYLERKTEAAPKELRDAINFLQKRGHEMPTYFNASNMIESLEEQLEKK